MVTCIFSSHTRLHTSACWSVRLYSTCLSVYTRLHAGLSGFITPACLSTHVYMPVCPALQHLPVCLHTSTCWSVRLYNTCLSVYTRLHAGLPGFTKTPACLSTHVYMLVCPALQLLPVCLHTFYMLVCPALQYLPVCLHTSTCWSARLYENTCLSVYTDLPAGLSGFTKTPACLSTHVYLQVCPALQHMPVYTRLHAGLPGFTTPSCLPTHVYLLVRPALRKHLPVCLHRSTR